MNKNKFNIKFKVYDKELKKYFHIEAMQWNSPCPDKSSVNPKYIRLRDHPEIHEFKLIRMDMKYAFDKFDIIQYK